MKYQAKQMSESLELGMVLALAGGFMDAYSYMCRDHVFANAQTGNLLLLGVNLSCGNWRTALRYLVPVLAFVAGLALANLFRLIRRGTEKLHWRQVTVALEALVLLGVSFLPQGLNLLANSLTSLACGIQVESFRTIHGAGVATTMCIGNLRSATQTLCEFCRTRDRSLLRRGGLYIFIILCFIVGAVLGNLAVTAFAEASIRIAAAILSAAFLMMFVDREKHRRQRSAEQAPDGSAAREPRD